MMQEKEVSLKMQLRDDGRIMLYVQDPELTPDYPSDRLIVAVYSPDSIAAKWGEGDVIRRGVLSE